MPVALFNSQTARMAGIKSGEPRRTNHVRFDTPVPTRSLTGDPDIARTVAQRVKLLTEQIAHAHTILNAEPKAVCEHCGQGLEMPPHHRAALLRALDNPFDFCQRESSLAWRNRNKGQPILSHASAPTIGKG